MNELQAAEKQLYELTQKVAQLRKDTEPTPVNDYSFKTCVGKVSLSDLFAANDILFMIHNMGQACRYCTLWADGLNGFIPHIESHYSLAMTSKDDPETQRRIANSRQWRFRMVSHLGGDYISEQSITPGQNNVPGLVCYIRKDGIIYRKNAAEFGPGDEFCSQWNILSLAGLGESDWVPQYNYWTRPQVMEDGGENLID